MTGVLLAVLFLRGVGVVAHRKEDADADAESEKTANDEEARVRLCVR